MKRFRFFLCVMALSLCVGTAGGVAQDQHGMAAETASAARLFENLGTYQHSISTTSELAQRYFNQGLRLTYGFNHAEAIRAFKEAVYTEDLKRNPKNGWSLYGLAQSLRAQGATAKAQLVEKELQKAWARADVKLSASRF